MAWWKDQEQGQEFSRPSVTAEDIMRLYLLQSNSIDGQTLFHLLEPLAGTSFLRKALREIQLQVPSRRRRTENSVYPHHLYHFWLGDTYPDQVERVTNAQRLDEAILAVHSHATHAIGIDDVSVLHWLKDPSEMMLVQGRWDDIYQDEERTQKAFSHHAGQRQFYKSGRYLHTIAASKIQYEDEAGLFEERTILPDGHHNTTFFIDGRQRAFVALSSSQQHFQRGYRMLYIGPRFSFDAARRT